MPRVFREWRDIAVYPHGGKGCWTLEERLDTARAHPYPNAPEEVTFEEGDSYVWGCERLDAFGEEFEAMELGLNGDVTIWTDRAVWYLSRYPRERMKRLSRHPPTED